MKKVLIILVLVMFLSGCKVNKTEKVISKGTLRKEVFALVSSAENSSIDYTKQYSYIEDINDGRGYTAGIIGFTSGTGDLLDVVNCYCKLKPKNDLKEYKNALEKVNGTDLHEGLGKGFENAWKKAAKDKEMIQAQNKILDEQYMEPAIEYATKDGLSPLGQYIYYDALVVHGSGESEDSFEAIRNKALGNKKAPNQGGNESKYLQAFLDARVPVMKMEEAHSDLSRLNTQRIFLKEKNFDLELPLKWTMYQQDFSLTKKQVNQLGE